MWSPGPQDPCYTIKIVSDTLSLHPQTIRNYERLGLINPTRSDGNVRLFSAEDMDRLKKIMSFKNMGVNLAGIEVIMKLIDQMEDLKRETSLRTRNFELEKPMESIIENQV